MADSFKNVEVTDADTIRIITEYKKYLNYEREKCGLPVLAMDSNRWAIKNNELIILDEGK